MDQNDRAIQAWGIGNEENIVPASVVAAKGSDKRRYFVGVALDHIAVLAFRAA